MFLSAAFFRRAGDHRSAGWQYTKLLYILRDVLRALPARRRRPLKNHCRIVLASAAAGARRNYDAASDNAYWLRDVRRKGEATLEARTERDASGLGNWDSREVDVLVEEFDSILEPLSAAPPPSRRPRVTSMYNRILELRLLAIQAGRFAERQALEMASAPSDRLLEIQDSIATNLTKVIGAWSAVIRIAGYFGESFNISHSLIASAHYRLAKALKSWSLNIPSGIRHPLYRNVLSSIDQIESIEAAINYHSSLAIRHYRQAMDVHDGGVAYRQVIDDMVFLNDDFNDDLYHFCAAQERYWLNRLSKDGVKPVVYERLDELKGTLAQKQGSAPGE